MLQVKICSLLWGFVSLLVCFRGDVGLNFWGFTGNVLRSDLVMLNDFIILDFASVKCLGLLNIIVFFSSSMEARNLMLLHGETLSSDRWHVQCETYHCLITLRVELLVISRLNAIEFRNTLRFGLNEWV